MDRISKFNLVHRYEKKSLLIAINCVAALSIFFFGYDQGVMGGVNTNRNYAETMQFGRWDEVTRSVSIDHTLLQGGIVSRILLLVNVNPHMTRWLSTIFPVHSLALYSVGILEIGSVVSRPSPLQQGGLSSVLHFNALLKMQTGCSVVSLSHV